MADIRKNGNPLDDFNRPNESPLLGPLGVEWSISDHGPFPVALDLVSFKATHGASPTGDMYWNQFSMDGDNAEVWGHATGGGTGGIAWALDLWTDVNGTNAVDGYRFRLESSPPAFVLYYFINGSSFGLDASIAPTDNEPGYMLMRRNGNDVEGWFGAQDTSTWTMVVSATDTQFTTGLFGGIGIRDNSQSQLLAWNEFGAGGVRMMPQIYRIVKGLK